MKFKTTRKEIMEMFGRNNVLSVGFCDLYNLLSCENPIAYTCGVYGWNADVYYIGNYAIVTGYRPFGRCTHGFIGIFEDRAKKIRSNRHYTQATKERKLHELLAEFCSKF